MSVSAFNYDFVSVAIKRGCFIISKLVPTSQYLRWYSLKSTGWYWINSCTVVGECSVYTVCT
jgi:hypothetical protein